MNVNILSLTSPELVDGRKFIDDRGSLSFVNELKIEQFKRFYLIENHKQLWLEREKEQIINAYDNGSDVNDDLKPLYGTPEQYYAEKYNNK